MTTDNWLANNLVLPSLYCLLSPGWISAIDIVTTILCLVFGQKTYKVLVREGVMCNYLLTKIIQIKLNPSLTCSALPCTTPQHPPAVSTGPSGDKWLQCCAVIRETIFIRTLQPPTTWAVWLSCFYCHPHNIMYRVTCIMN